MIKPELFDVVELLVDLPEHNLRPGVQGAIVHCHPDDTYEVEFTNEDGETVVLCPLSADQFVIVWQAKTRTWLPVSERVATLVTYLPEEAGREVLDFARFLRLRRPQQQAESTIDRGG
jgi:hypothetical protein